MNEMIIDRNLNDCYERLYSTDLKKIESNLDKFIEAKHETLKRKHKIDSNNL